MTKYAHLNNAIAKKRRTLLAKKGSFTDIPVLIVNSNGNIHGKFI